jgi:hypothetical protein
MSTEIEPQLPAPKSNGKARRKTLSKDHALDATMQAGDILSDDGLFGDDSAGPSSNFTTSGADVANTTANPKRASMFNAGDHEDVALRLLRKVSRKRKQPKQSPVSWFVSRQELDAMSEDFVNRCHRLTRGKKVDLAALADHPALLHEQLPFEHTVRASYFHALALAYAWPWICELNDSPEELAAQNRLADYIDASWSNAHQVKLHSDPLAYSLARCELGVILAMFESDESDSNRVLFTAMQSVGTLLQEIMDGDGVILSRYVEISFAILASLTRALVLADRQHGSFLDEDSRSRFEWFVLQSLKMIRKDGTPLLTTPKSMTFSPDMFDLALQIVDDKKDRRAAKLALPGSSSSIKKKRGNSKTADKFFGRLPELSAHSDMSQLAILQSGWESTDARMAVTYPKNSYQIELCCGETLLTGDWTFELKRDGQKLAVALQWDYQCWHSDEDVDYLELEATFVDGTKLQRQVLLARDEQFLFLADAIISKVSGKLEYESRLPLAAGTSWKDAAETSEGWLVQGKRTFSVVAPALPEWRTQSSNDRMTLEDQSIVIKRTVTAPSLYSPVFIDLDRWRSQNPLTWRQLTVAEDLQIVRPDIAVAYRVHASHSQWLFYRSLTPKRSRTALGKNIADEFYAGTFDADGESTTLIRIE